MIKYIFSILIIIVLVGCLPPSGVHPLPDEYIMCTHHGGEVFAYTVDNASRLEAETCSSVLIDPEGNCPILYIIEDVSGKTRYYTELEMKNWNCI